jgi:hypothetical protein
MNDNTQVQTSEAGDVQITQNLGKYQQSEFVEKADVNELQLLKCPSCGNMHFRHAGYMLASMPYVDKQEAKIAVDNVQVMLCIKCKHSYIHRDGKLQDVTEHIDVKGWEKTEKEAHKQTGPGGQC